MGTFLALIFILWIFGLVFGSLFHIVWWTFGFALRVLLWMCAVALVVALFSIPLVGGFVAVLLVAGALIVRRASQAR